MVAYLLFFILTVRLGYGSSMEPCGSISSRLGVFSRDKLSVTHCAFSSDFVTDALREGLENICRLNPKLVDEIITKRLKIPLSVSCDVGGAADSKKFPYAKVDSATRREIHVWRDVQSWAFSSKEIRQKSSIFHEFLHYVDFPVDPTDDYKNHRPVPTDLVYACHVTGYPMLGPHMMGSVETFEEARRSCGRFVF